MANEGAAEFAVNTTTSGRQDSPQIAALESGGFAVVWENRSDIRLRSFNASGEPVGQEIGVAPTSALRFDPIVTPTAGGFLVIWTLETFTGANWAWSLRGRFFDADAEPVGAVFDVSPTEYNFDPVATTTASGDVLVVWLGVNFEYTEEIYGRLIGPTGSSEGEPFVIATDVLLGYEETRDARPFDLVRTASGSVLVWKAVESDDDERTVIKGVLLDDSGAVIAEFNAGEPDADVSRYAPTTTALPEGGFVVTWVEQVEGETPSYAVKAQRFDAEAISVGAEFVLVQGSSSHKDDPTLVVTNKGFVLAYEESGSVWVQEYDAAGQPMGALLELASSAADPAITALADGSFMVVWSSTSGSDVDVRGQRIVLSIPTTDFDDQLAGSAWNDVIDALGGDDVVNGGGGADRLSGGDGDDLLISEDGEDQVFGGAGSDFLAGGSGRDSLAGDDANDTVYAGGGGDLLAGGAGDDLLIGEEDGDTAYGGEGNDLISGGVGDDVLFGEAGSDRIYASDGADVVIGGIDDDQLYLGEGNDYAEGGDGGDLLIGEGGFDQLYGGEGRDYLDGGADGDVLIGQGGDDEVHAGDAQDFIFGEAGRDVLLGEGGNDVAQGGDGDDLIAGGAGADVLIGAAGNDEGYGGDDADYLAGEDGNDTLVGEGGRDELQGGAGRDLLVGGLEGDVLVGGSEDDTAFGGEGGDILVGESGADVLIGGEGGDYVDGGSEGDILIGEAGRDEIQGGSGADYIDGGADDDFVIGGDGADELRGGQGADYIAGGEGGDVLIGGGGDDLLLGGAGADYLLGGDGADVFEFAAGSSSPGAFDLVDGFASGSDKLDLRGLRTGGPDALSVQQFGGVTFVSVDQGSDGTVDFTVQVNGTVAAGDYLF